MFNNTLARYASVSKSFRVGVLLAAAAFLMGYVGLMVGAASSSSGLQAKALP